MKVMQYTAVPGFFLHDEEPEGPVFRAKTRNEFGIKEREYETDRRFWKDFAKLSPEQQEAKRQGASDQWLRFEYFLNHLNAAGQGKVEWKVIYVVRHGEGYHNVKERQVGRAEWERYWSRVDGDDNSTWRDSHLTPTGQQQAVDVRSHVGSSRPYRPQSVYTSPLTRCLETTTIIWGSSSRRYLTHATVMENLRERFGVHTCDRRSRKSWIQANFPFCKVGEDMTEQDELWQPTVRETEQEAARRARSALHDIWTSDRNTFIAITAHSGFIRSLYAAVKHADVWVAPGQIMPIFIKGEMVDA
ncbi:phosphoglycerate mutase-like protein [Rostrohypoxylon terebratum]|nr:phosphoglycerate mutase-like protein [Rostrohypoxylon terebratum]